MAFGTGSKWKGLDVSVYVEQAINSGFGFIDTAACEWLHDELFVDRNTDILTDRCSLRKRS